MYSQVGLQRVLLQACGSVVRAEAYHFKDWNSSLEGPQLLLSLLVLRRIFCFSELYLEC